MQEKGGNCSSPKTLVLLAALNEEVGIEFTLRELKKHVGNARFLVVDGNSTDRTVSVAKNLGADVIHQEGKGKGDAIGFALKCVDEDFNYVALIDADYTYPAKYIPQMIVMLDSNPHLGMICGNRFNSQIHTEWMSNAFYVGNRMLALTHNLLNGVDIHDPLTGLRVVRWKILKNWQPKSKGFDIEAEMNYHVESSGYRIQEINIEYRPRFGEKKLKIYHGFHILKRMISEITLIA